MTVSFDTSFLLGLYLFLRQLQLSIDRSLNDDWKKLVVYLSSKTSIQAVIDKLQSASRIELDTRTIEMLERPTVSKGIFSSVSRRKNCLSDEELIYIYAKLKTLTSFLLKNEPPDRDLLINLRMELQHSEQIVANRLSKGCRRGKDFVEHFNQNQNFDCKEVEKLVGRPWL